MNWIDLIVIGALGIGIFSGFRRGLIKALTGFVGVGFAIWVGFNFSNLLETYVVEYDFVPENLVKMASLLLTIFLAYLAINLVSKVLHKTVHTVGLGILNRLGGALFSALLNLLAISAIIYYTLPFLPAVVGEEMVNESIALPYLMEVVEILKISVV